VQEGHQARSQLWAVVRAVFTSQAVPTSWMIKAGRRKAPMEEHKPEDRAAVLTYTENLHLNPPKVTEVLRACAHTPVGGDQCSGDLSGCHHVWRLSERRRLRDHGKRQSKGPSTSIGTRERLSLRGGAPAPAQLHTRGATDCWGA